MTILESARNKAPVFVLGSPRSGTTLLYDMLLSAGGFAVYLAESNVFNLLAPRFGDLSVPQNRQNLIQVWLQTKLFKASGLDADRIGQKLAQGCRNAGDFLSIIMGEIAAQQGMQRWAENSPEGMLYLPLIKRLIPDALVIHIIRDGRDVAASLGKLKYVRPSLWRNRPSFEVAGLYWEWMVQHGREYGQALGPDYIEVHFEDLIASPQPTLDRIASFIDHELDYVRIKQVAYGSLTKPNTSFRKESAASGFNPVGRWRTAFSEEQLLRFERLLGTTLRQLGYTPATQGATQGSSLRLAALRWKYRKFFEAKLVYKNSALVRALLPALTPHDIDEVVLADDHPAIVKADSQTPAR